MSNQDQIIEHIVLFNVKPDVNPTKVVAMIDGLNRMASLNLSIHVSAGELLRSRSDSDSLTFSHIMHTRFTSNDNLQVYYTHPEHLRMVSQNIHPIIDDIMIVDWISNNISHEAPKPGSVMRVTLLKMKDDFLENDKSKFFEMMEGIKNQFKAIDHVSFGENSHAMAKGYSISSIVVFSGISELEAFDSDAEVVKSLEEKVKDLIESELVVDYVIPLPKVADD